MYDKYCKTCETSLGSFYATGMLGCPNCYKAFESDIELALKKIQGRTFHAGKTPVVTKLDRELVTEYGYLLKEKERAGLEGRFQDMIRITEDINALTEELKRRGLK